MVIAYEPGSARPAFAERYPEAALELQFQAAGLGERLTDLAARRDGPCLFSGSDCPTTPLSSFHRAMEVLGEGTDVVFCPTEDGGTCILGGAAVPLGLVPGCSLEHG